MPDFGVIAEVSETLQRVLDDALSTLVPPPAPRAVLENLQGPIQTNPPTVAVFLYEVIEDSSVRNRPHRREDAPPNTTKRKPPLALKLKYLLTPFAGDRLTEYRMLGRAMQVLYDQAILSGPVLQGTPAPAGLVASSEELKVTLAPLTLEERTRVWHSVDRPYRLSVSYEVRVVNIDALDTVTGPAVRERRLERAEAVSP